MCSRSLFYHIRPAALVKIHIIIILEWSVICVTDDACLEIVEQRPLNASSVRTATVRQKGQNKCCNDWYISSLLEGEVVVSHDLLISAV